MKRVFKKKILPEYFEAVADGTKKFELRKDDDGVKVGDCLRLCEFTCGKYTGREVTVDVTYTLRDAEEYGLMPGYVIIGIEKGK